MPIQLTVYFEDPFWVGLFERREAQQLTVCIVFGSKPRDVEVQHFLRENFFALRFSAPVEGTKLPSERRINPKRAQREARRQMEAQGPSSAAQEALQRDLEARKKVRQEKSREQREAEAQRQFELRQEKRKQKHRGH